MAERGEAGFHMTESILGKAGSKNGKSDLARPPAQPPKCPECTSQRVWKDGTRYTKQGDVQRYLCRNCGYRFSKNGSRDPSEPLKNRSSWSINRTSAYSLDRQVCELLTEGSKNLASAYSLDRQVCELLTEGSKNLVEVASRTEKRAAGATSAEVKGKIIDYTWWMKKQGYAKTTIRVNSNVLKVLSEKGADIFNSDSVKEAIANQNWSEARRHTAIASYTLFLKMLGRRWEPPLCRVTRKLPFIPKEAEIDALIAGCGKKTATLLQLIKETAMRSGEANSLLWINLDIERRTITLNQPEKRGNPRIFKASNKLIAMLNTLPKTSQRIFGDSTTSSKKSTFFQTRRTLARKLQNPRLLRISFHTLRHWKATMLYHQTKDILYVKQFLGHKKIETTLLYIQLVSALFNESVDEFHVRVASKPDEIKRLLEAGFEFVCEKADLLYFRKRK